MEQHRNHLGQPIGAPLPDWSPRPHPPRSAMTGRFCTVEPLDPERHAAQLVAAYADDADGWMWTYLPRGPYASLEEYRDWAETACRADDPLVHAIIDNATGAAVGTASYMRIEPQIGVIEIGSITYSPRLQRRPAGTEAMYLMMRRVFDELGYRRYEWKCNSLNLPSRAAALRYGFQYEGLFRQAQITRGHNRDTMWFSIIDSEWPGLRAAFEGWLDPANFNADGQQRRSLASLRSPAGWTSGHCCHCERSEAISVGTANKGAKLLRFARNDNRGPPSLALLAAVTALAFCALHIVVPALPLLARVFDDSPAHVQLVLTLYLAGIASGQLVYGPLSDRFGRRPVLLLGLAMFLGGTVVCGVAWSLAALIVGRVLEGLGACAGIVLARAIIRDVYEREAAARGLAIVMMAMTLAPAISPALGAYLAEWVDWRAIFLLLGVLGGVVLALTVARLGETNAHPARLDLVGMAGSYAALLRSPQFLGFALCSACTSASWFTFIASAPHILSALGEPPSTYGLMILLPMATYMLGNGAAARFALRFGSLRLLIIGRTIALTAAVAMTLWYIFAGLSIWTVFLPIALCEIGDGLSQPAAMAAGLSIQPRLAGTASGLMGFLQMTTASLGTFVVALLPYPIAVSMIAVVGGFIALALGFGLFALRRPRSGSMPDAPALRLTREESA